MIYDISYKTLISTKPLRIRFNRIDGFIRVYDGTRYLTLFGSGKYEAFYDRMRYLIRIKSGIAYIFSHYFEKIKVGSYDFWPIGKILNMYNFITLIKSVLNKDKIHYHYNIFSEKLCYQLAKK